MDTRQIFYAENPDHPYGFVGIIPGDRMGPDEARAFLSSMALQRVRAGLVCDVMSHCETVYSVAEE